MKAKFKSRRKFSKLLFKGILCGLILISAFVLMFKIFYDNIKINVDNNTYLSYLVNDSFGNYDLKDISNLSSMEFLLKYSFGIKNFNSGLNDIHLDLPVNTTINEEEKDTNNEPYVYIFNSHQSENYRSNLSEEFNINNTVYLASHILKEYLEDLGISVVVEENSIVDVLNTNGWKYASSYKASRILLEQAVTDNPSLGFFIDLHRDAASYEATTVELDGKKYAKIMFVVGKEHDGYEKNLELANALNEKIKAISPSLSRGVLQKEGKGVNGIYNQDFSPNTILIEVGGQYNYVEEVNNILKLFANVLYEYFEENKWKRKTGF